MDNAPSDPLSTTAVILIVATVFVILGVAVPALTFRLRQPQEKIPQFIRRVFSRRRK